MCETAALVGFPNAGKTTLFNALTGAQERTGNWHGVTVTASRRPMKGGGVLYDLPGIYGVSATSPEERVSRDFIENNPDALFLCVISAHDFRRGIAAAEKLMRIRRTAVVLTFFDEYEKAGGKIDLPRLSGALKREVFAVNAADKKTLSALAARLQRGGEVSMEPPDVGGAVRAFSPPARRENPLDKLLFNKWGAAGAFLLSALLVFWLAFGSFSPGALLLSLFERAFSALETAFESALSAAPEAIRSLVCDGLLGGVFSVLSFLPQLCILFLSLTLLEESGLMARFAFMSDGLFEKIGLNGRAFFSLFSGYGCTAVAALSTRSLENDALKKRTVLLLPFVSCSARLPVYVMVANAVFPFAKPVLLAGIYLGGLALACLVSALLHKTVFKNNPPFVMEMPALRKVGAKKLAKALHYYAKQFIIRVGGVILAVTLALWFAGNFSPAFVYVGGGEESILYLLGKGLKYLFYPMGITDWRVSVAILSGLFAKEAVAGSLSLLCGPLSGVFTPEQGLAFLAFFALCTPCLSALAAMKKEIGLKYTLLSAFGMFLLALLAGYAAYFFAVHLAACTCLALIAATAGGIYLCAKKGGCAACGRGDCAICKRQNGKTRKTAGREGHLVRGGAESAAQAGRKGERQAHGQGRNRL